MGTLSVHLRYPLYSNGFTVTGLSLLCSFKVALELCRRLVREYVVEAKTIFCQLEDGSSFRMYIVQCRRGLGNWQE